MAFVATRKQGTELPCHIFTYSRKVNPIVGGGCKAEGAGSVSWGVVESNHVSEKGPPDNFLVYGNQ